MPVGGSYIVGLLKVGAELLLNLQSCKIDQDDRGEIEALFLGVKVLAVKGFKARDKAGVALLVA